MKGNLSEAKTIPFISIEHKASRAGSQSPHLAIKVQNPTKMKQKISIVDNVYGKAIMEVTLKPNSIERIAYPTENHCWYDVTMTSDQCVSFSLQAAGRIELNAEQNFQAVTDPELGNFDQLPSLKKLQRA